MSLEWPVRAQAVSCAGKVGRGVKGHGMRGPVACAGCPVAMAAWHRRAPHSGHMMHGSRKMSARGPCTLPRGAHQARCREHEPPSVTGTKSCPHNLLAWTASHRGRVQGRLPVLGRDDDGGRVEGAGRGHAVQEALYGDVRLVHGSFELGRQNSAAARCIAVCTLVLAEEPAQ